VCFVQEAKTQGNMDIGKLYLGRDVNGENVNEAIVAEGLVDVRRVKNNEEEARYASLDEAAKNASKGKHSSEASEKHVRDIKWTVDNPTKFVDSFRGKPVDAIIEYIKDGSTYRALLVPSMH
jgi:staphylococcal nuclease domain-containing protein 1